MTRRYDIVLAGVTIVLVLCGLTFVYSASSYHDGQAGNSFHHLQRQALATLLGLGALIAFARTPYRRLSRYIPHLAAAACLGLVLVWVPGLSHKANGATRWLDWMQYFIAPYSS
jgi:cell division protein FtsW